MSPDDRRLLTVAATNRTLVIPGEVDTKELAADLARRGLLQLTQSASEENLWSAHYKITEAGRSAL